MPQNRSHSRDLTHRLLVGIGLEGRKAVIAESLLQPLRPGQVLFQKGGRASQLFVLRKGRVLISRITSTGHEITMGILAPGDVFGLGSLVERYNYIGTAQALDRGEVQVWSHKAIHQLAARYPKISENVLRIALDRVAQFVEQREALITASAEHRLAGALTRLGSRTGTTHPSGVEVRIKNEQLASLADVTPFTASRVLQRWERQGIVRKGRGVVHILVPEKLVLD